MSANISIVRAYKPDGDSLRTVLPKSILGNVGVSNGTALSWSVLDEQTLIAKVVA